MLSEGARPEKSTARCRVEAAAWRVHLTETGQASVPAFEAWLAADARHRAAWDEVQRSWRLLEEQQAGRITESELNERAVRLPKAPNAVLILERDR